MEKPVPDWRPMTQEQHHHPSAAPLILKTLAPTMIQSNRWAADSKRRSNTKKRPSFSRACDHPFNKKPISLNSWFYMFYFILANQKGQLLGFLYFALVLCFWLATFDILVQKTVRLEKENVFFLVFFFLLLCVVRAGDHTSQPSTHHTTTVVYNTSEPFFSVFLHLVETKETIGFLPYCGVMFMFILQIGV